MARRTHTTIAKSVTPSMRAAAMIIVVRMSPRAVGWRAEPSRAAAASLPMPRPAPMTARPAPKPAERKARAAADMSFSCVDAGGVYRAAVSRGAYRARLPMAGSRPGHVRTVGVRRAHARLGVTLIMLLVVPVVGEALTDEERGEHREDVRLHEPDEELEHEDRHRHRDGADRHPLAVQRVDEAEQREDDDVPREHVREETDGEGEGLREEAEDLDRHHDAPERPRDAAGEVLQPRAEPHRLDGRVLGDDEGEEREGEGDPEVAGRGRRVRDEPEQVHEQDEEEGGDEVGDEPLAVLLADVLERDLVPHELHEHLEEVVEPARHEAAPPHRAEEHQD